MKFYKFIGDGAGVPGLPHEIPEKEAAQYGDLLQSAIDAGLYEPDGSSAVGADLRVRPDEPTKRKSKASEPAEGD